MSQISDLPQKSVLSATLNVLPGARRIVHSSFARALIGALWSRYPLKRKLPGSGIVYEIRDLENLYSAEEVFKRESYQMAFHTPVSTFIDLGANCGYFTCYLAHKAGGRPVRGILVEANGRLLPEIRRHLEMNHLSEAKLVHGLVGRDDPSVAMGDLVLSDAHTSSSQSGVHPHAKWKGFGRKVRVHYIDILTEWRACFGDERVDLLKIDIEGSEEAFLFEEPSILPFCDKVVIECHKWIVNRDRLFERLESFGLRHEKTLEENESFEVALFHRSSRI